MAHISRVAFAGGGSGGHVYPLIAVADEMKSLDPQLECFFVSTRGSIEEKLVPRAGYKLELVPSGKLKGQGIFQTLKTFLLLLLSVLKCIYLVLRKRPDFVFSAGGYAGAPYVVSAALLGVPCAILEQNRIPGLANRWMAKFCKKVFLNFSGSQDAFPGKEIQVVGHPCRRELESARWWESETAKKFQTMPFRIFIFGGSQGAVGINRLITAALPYLQELDIFLHHQTGALDFEIVNAEYKRLAFTRALVEPYVYDMAGAYRDAQLVVCRSGASSLAELAAIGKAAILIPLVSKDKHQEHNAQAIAQLGSCEFHLQTSLNGEKLAAILKELYYDRSKLTHYASVIHSLHHPDAAATIARSILGK